MKNYRYFLKINKLTASIITALFWTGNAAAVNTHIQTDGTLSGIAELNIDAPGSGLPYTLSEINGKLSGHNLFYSFSSFSIGTADSVLFDLNTPDLAHVISRVTGGFESLIDGKLQMTNAGSTPSFFFINPAGITFSSGASVDVPGSFYVSTASGLNFSDGGQLAANETSASSLSSANPESFGFLGNESGSINIGSLETNATGLVFKPGTDVVFTANRMQIDNATIGNSNSSTQTGVDLQLIATGSEATDIQLNASPDHATSGDLVFHNANLMISGNGLGHLGIRAGGFPNER
jgi:filamentous hemagglutinin family protein